MSELLDIWLKQYPKGGPFIVGEYVLYYLSNGMIVRAKVLRAAPRRWDGVMLYQINYPEESYAIITGDQLGKCKQ